MPPGGLLAASISMHRHGGSSLERLLGYAGDLLVLRVVFGKASGAHFGFSGRHFGPSGRSFWSLGKSFLSFEGDFFSLDSIRSSGFHFPRFFGIIFAVELIFATTKLILGHIELILNANSFAICYSTTTFPVEHN